MVAPVKSSAPTALIRAREPRTLLYSRVMQRRIAVLLAGASLAGATLPGVWLGGCSPSGADVDAGTGMDASEQGHCCDPAGAPACGMAFGGWVDPGVACPHANGLLPDFHSSQWTLAEDDAGCPRWTLPGIQGTECGPAADGGGPCPNDETGFQPSAAEPANPAQDVCTPQQVDGYWASCLAPNVPAVACDAWLASDAANNQACGDCIATSELAQSWGAVVLGVDGVARINTAGCIALLTGDDPPKPGGCAAAYQAARDCETAGCTGCNLAAGFGCTSPACYQQCVDQVAAGTCKPVEDSVCDPDASTFSACFDSQGNGAEGLFKSVASVFCASGQ